MQAALVHERGWSSMVFSQPNEFMRDARDETTLKSPGHVLMQHSLEPLRMALRFRQPVTLIVCERHCCVVVMSLCRGL